MDEKSQLPLQSAPPAYEETKVGEETPSPPSYTGRTPAHVDEPYGPGAQCPDFRYIRRVQGIAKIAEMLFSVSGFIINMVLGHHISYVGIGFPSFATINGFLQGLIWFILHLLHALPQILANFYIELIMCAVIDLFLLIATVVAAASCWKHPLIIAITCLCFAATVAYGVDCTIQIRDIRRKIYETLSQRGDAEQRTTTAQNQ